eukprot:UN24058
MIFRSGPKLPFKKLSLSMSCKIDTSEKRNCIRISEVILLFITMILKVENKKREKNENERLNLKKHCFDLSFRICRKKSRGRMEKRRTYFFLSHKYINFPQQWL